MIPLDLSGKTALVTGLADNVGFAWSIAKALQGAGADVIASPHPRVAGILSRFLTREKDKDSRALPGGGEFAPKAVIPCDVSYDVADDVPADLRDKKGYEGLDVSIEGLVKGVKEHCDGVDILVHSVAFSPEISKDHIDVSRAAYMTAMSVSSYSLVSLCRAIRPLMAGRAGSVTCLSYLAAERVVPFYGGGMASAKAALECDARMCAWFMGEDGHRVNVVSAGPYASRAAKSIGDIQKMVDYCAERSPIKAAVTPEQVANTVLFLSSNMSSGITGSTVYVDSGYHAMGM